MLRFVVVLSFALFVVQPSVFAQNCTINAGVATDICASQPFQLHGSASGHIASNAVWTQVSGPAVTITDPSNLNSMLTGYPASGTYKFRLSATCTDGSLIYDEVTYRTLPVTKANAGPSVNACPPNITLAANTPAADEKGVWSAVGVLPLGVQLSGAASPNAAVNIPSGWASKFTLRWTIQNNNACTTSSDVTITSPGGASPVSAGRDTVLSNCYSTTQSYALHASFGGDGTNNQVGTWSLVSGPSMPGFNNIHNNEATVSPLVAGTYILRWTVAGPCLNGVSEIKITVPQPTQSVTNAGGSTQTFCDGRSTVVLTAPAPAYTGETGMWTKTSGAGTIDNPGNSTVTVTGLNGSSSSFAYTIKAASGCSSKGTYTVNFTAAPVVSVANPVITPGCDSATASIAYTASGGNQTQWALISAPAGAALAAANKLNTYSSTVGNPMTLTGLDVAGTYNIRLKRTTDNGNGGCADAYADVTIIASKNPTASNAGTKQILACTIDSTNLAGNIPAVGAGAWSQVSGPNTALIMDKSNNTTLLRGLTNGLYTMRWIITGGPACGNRQSDVSVLVAFKTPTAANAGADRKVCAASPVQLDANTAALNETGTWTVSPSTGITIADKNNPKAIANGLKPNTAYTFTWTITNACGQTTDDVVLTTSADAGPQQAAAGASQCLAQGVTGFSLSANAPAAGETGLWTIVSGPNTAGIANASKNNTTVSGAVNGNYQVEWSISKPGCGTTRDTVLVTIAANATKAIAGADQKLCAATSYTFTANTPTTGTGSWLQTEGPGGAMLTDATKANTTVTGLTEGRYAFRWLISNGACASNYSDVHITIATPPTAAVAGADQSLCTQTSTKLAANAITTGTGLWSVVSGPGNVHFSSEADPNAVISGLKAGTYQLKWAAANEPDCPVSSSVLHIFVTQPAALTSTSSKLCNSTTAQLTGNDGSRGVWSLTEGNAVTLTPVPNAGNAVVASGMSAGNRYVFTYTIPAAGSCAATSATDTITISAPASVADAGPDQSLCLHGASLMNVTLAANVPSVGAGQWSVVSAPASSGASFVQPAVAGTTLQNARAGVYLLKWNITNDACSANNDMVRISLFADPSDAKAGDDQLNGCTSNITLTGNTPLTGMGAWTQTAGPNTATIDAPNAPVTKVLNTLPGTYTFLWTISNGACNAKSDDVTVTVTSVPPHTADANVNKATAVQVCNDPGPSTTVSLHGNTPATNENGKWTVLTAIGSQPVFSAANDPAATVSGLTGGNYVFQWTLTEGSCQSNDVVNIMVYEKPTPATATAVQDGCLYGRTQLDAAPVTTGTGAWTIVSGPSTPVFSDNTLNNPVITGLQQGEYVFSWATVNGACTGYAPAVVHLTAADCRIQVVKKAATPVLNEDGSYTVSFTFVVTNPGSADISNVQVTDNLRTAFPLPNSIKVKSVTATGVLAAAVNNNFNGDTAINLLNSAQAALAANASETITLTVTVNLN